MMDLSGLDQFKASGLLEAGGARAVPGEMALDLIDFDAEQPRTQLNEQSLQELAESIRQHGVLEPVSLRPHPERPGRYIVNRGERRCRASRIAGRHSVPYFVDVRLDRFAQAVENLQREDLSPFDLARFIATREREDKLSRAEIGRRLQKPASFITEVAALVDAPAAVRAAYYGGRARDTRVLYLLMREQRRQPAAVQALLAGTGLLNRELVERALALASAAPHEAAPQPATERPARVSSAERAQAPSPVAGDTPGSLPQAAALVPGDALLVECAGRQGRLSWSARPSTSTGEVRFDDGSTVVIELSELRLLQWSGS